MPTVAVHIGRRLRAARENAGLTQREAADATGLTIASLGNWERGGGTPSARRCFALADAYGLTLDELLGYPIDGA